MYGAKLGRTNVLEYKSIEGIQNLSSKAMLQLTLYVGAFVQGVR